MSETAAETIFPAYRTIEGKFKIPTGRVLRRAGETTEEIAYAEVNLNKTHADAAFQIPMGFTLETAAANNQPPITKLAEDVYAARAADGYNVMFAAMNDYIIVFEAPINDSASNGVIAKIKETVPNKPIRYVVTHHHTDHSGGVRAYVREGANIITTPGNKNFFTRMVEDVFTPSLSGRKPIARREFIETFSNKKRVFADGKQIVELYDIGPGPHAEEMVVAYLPNEKIIFQGDLFNPPVFGRVENVGNATTRHFAERLEKSKLPVEKIVAVHGRIATPDEMNRSLKSSFFRRKSQTVARSITSCQNARYVKIGRID